MRNSNCYLHLVHVLHFHSSWWFYDSIIIPSLFHHSSIILPSFFHHSSIIFYHSQGDHPKIWLHGCLSRPFSGLMAPASTPAAPAHVLLAARPASGNLEAFATPGRRGRRKRGKLGWGPAGDLEWGLGAKLSLYMFMYNLGMFGFWMSHGMTRYAQLLTMAHMAHMAQWFLSFWEFPAPYERQPIKLLWRFMLRLQQSWFLIGHVHVSTTFPLKGGQMIL